MSLKVLAFDVWHVRKTTNLCWELRFIQVRPNPKSENPNDVTFFVMRSDHDGDDISSLEMQMVVLEGCQDAEGTDRGCKVSTVDEV